MSKTIAILGKSGVGKTFLAAHLAMAFGYYGDKTLLVGCDLKRDTTLALARHNRPSLVEALELLNYAHEELDPSEIIVPVTEYVSVMEIGPSQLMVGNYSSVLDEAFNVFQVHNFYSRYDRIIYDVNDERFDASFAPLYHQVEGAVAVTDDTPESLFILNRLLRAALIGSYEFDLPMRIVGAVNNRSIDSRPFERYVERTRCFPLLTIEEYPELARLRRQHQTLFTLKNLSPRLEQLLDDLLKMAELIRGDPFNLYPVSPLADEEIWELGPDISLPN